MTFFNGLFFSIAALVAASYGTASAASITSCTISHYGTNQILAQNSGETSCAAHIDPPPAPPVYYALDSQAKWTQTGPLSFSASARSQVGSDCCGFPARVDSVAEGWTREDFYFADAPAGSTLRIDWMLLPDGPDSSEHTFIIAGLELNEFFANRRTELPVLDDGPVILETYLRQACYVFSSCIGETRFLLESIDLVDASGVSQTGYRYGLASGSYLGAINGVFPGGVLDQSLPEPSTFLLTGGALFVAALAQIRRR